MTHPKARPEWITPEQLRAYLTPTHINKFLSVDGISAAGYINRRERTKRPIKSFRVVDGQKRYRALNVIAAARADQLEIGPPKIILQRNALTKNRTTLGQIKCQIADLTDSISTARHELGILDASMLLTGKAFRSEQEIVQAATSMPVQRSGIYFLIKNGRVVYVGQSTSVLARVGHHMDKDFDSFTFIPCAAEALDAYESIYIHLMRPELNGRSAHGTGAMCAPISLDRLFEAASKLSRRSNAALEPLETAQVSIVGQSS